MLKFRTFIFYCYFYLWNALMLVGRLPTLLLPKNLAIKLGPPIWSKGIIFGLRFFARIKFEQRGLENLKIIMENSKAHGGGFIIASQHQSAFETLVFYALMPKTAYVLKREILLLPLLGLYPWRLGSVPLNRKAGVSALKKLLKEVSDLLSKGYQVILFPEGTRAPVEEILPIQSGVLAIYSSLKTPILPMRLNSGNFWPRKGWMKYPGTIIFEYGEVVNPGLSKEELKDKLIAFYHNYKTNF